MNIHKLISFFILLVFIACRNETSLNNEPISISLSNSNMLLSEYLSKKIENDIIYTSLETSRECLLGAMLDMTVEQDRLYILDKHLRKKIFVFSNSGEFQFDIGEIGKGNQEYLRINDFDIVNETIITLVEKGKSLLFFFDKTTGNFIKQEQIPNEISAFSIKKKSNDNYLFYNGGINKIKNVAYNLILSNSSGNVQKGVLKTDNELPPNTEVCIYKDGCTKRCYYWDPIMNKVIEIFSHETKEIIRIAEAEKQRKDIRNSNNLSTFFMNKEPLYILSKVACNSKFCYLLVAKQKIEDVVFFHVFYNFENNEYKVYKDESKNTPSIQAPYFYENDFYCLASSEFVNKIQKKDTFNIGNNPVLIKIKINQ